MSRDVRQEIGSGRQQQEEKYRIKAAASGRAGARDRRQEEGERRQEAGGMGQGV